MKSIRALLIVASLLAVLSGQSAASSTGNLTGIVTDSIVGNPAAGVRVVVEGISRETKTDPDGRFVVRDISPGVYRLRFEVDAARKCFVEQVAVVAGQITELNVDIGDGVSTVLAPDRFVPVGTNRVIRRAELERWPVSNIVDALSILSASAQPWSERAAYVSVFGVASSEFTNVNGWNNLYVRGGDEYELGYRINGWAMHDPFTGEWLARMPMAAVSGLSLRMSAIGSDVGNFSSGVVDVYGLKPTSTFQTSISARTDAAASALGASSFDQASYSLASTGPLWKNKIGYAMAVDWLNADDLEPGVYGSPIYRIVDKPYYTGSYRRDSVEFDGTRFRHGARADLANGGDYVNAYGVLTFHPARNLNIETTGLYSYLDRNVFFDPWATSPQHVPHSRRSTSFFGISGEYRASENLSFNARLGRYQTDYEIADRLYFDDIRKDLSVLQTWDSVGSTLDNFDLFLQPRDRYEGYEKQHSESWTMNGSARLRWMENHAFEIGFGVQSHALRYFNLLTPYPDFDYDIVTANAYGYKAAMSGERIVVVENNTGIDKAPHPLEAGAYASHDFVSEYFSTTLGLRYDVFDFDQQVLGPNFGDDHQLDPSDYFHPKANGEVSYRLGAAAFTPHLFDDFLSIRAWINYERFAQAPPYELLYAGSNYLRNVMSLGVFGYANNWSAKPMTTRQLEIGKTVATSNAYASALYYDRRQHDAISGLYPISVDPGYKSYFSHRPIDRVTTGWEFSAGASWQSTIELHVSEGWMVSKEAGHYDGSGFHFVWLGYYEEVTYKSSSRWERRRVQSADLSVTASKENGLLSRTSFLESLSLGLTYQNKFGTPYTPVSPSFMDFYGNSDGRVVGRANSKHTPSSSIVNLIITTERRLSHFARLLATLEILNLLDSRTVEDVYASSGFARTDGYLNSAIGQTHAASLGPRFVQQYQIREKSAFNYGPPRQVRLSFGLQF